MTSSGYFSRNELEKGERLLGDGDEKGDFDLALNTTGETEPILVELNNVWLFRELCWWIGEPILLTILNPCFSSDFLRVEWVASGNSPLVWRRVVPVFLK